MTSNTTSSTEHTVIIVAIIHGYLTAARLADISGAQSKSHDLLEQLRVIGDARSLPRLCVASLGEEIRILALRQQDKACQARLAALQQLERERASTWGILKPLMALQFGIARAHAAMVSYRWDLVLPELEAIDPLAKQMRRVREAIQVQLLRALAGRQRGEDCGAMIGEGVSLAATLGLGRVLADTSPAFSVSATAAATGVRTGLSSPAGQREPARGGGRARGQPRVLPNALLTPKETEVLLLAANLSNKKIAQALEVGDQTVKWHLKNMFHKLQAGTRLHLLARARMLGILE